MADRNKTETGSQQRTILDESTGIRRADRDFAVNPRLDQNGKPTQAEEDAINEAENRAIRENRRDRRRDEKIPDDPLDPASGKEPGKKNPHT